MIRGSLTDLEIFVARENAVGGFNRLKGKAAQVEDAAWQMFYAGAMFMAVRKFDRQLAELGVVVSDG